MVFRVYPHTTSQKQASRYSVRNTDWHRNIRIRQHSKTRQLHGPGSWRSLALTRRRLWSVAFRLARLWLRLSPYSIAIKTGRVWQACSLTILGCLQTTVRVYLRFASHDVGAKASVPSHGIANQSPVRRNREQICWKHLHTGWDDRRSRIRLAFQAFKLSRHASRPL